MSVFPELPPQLRGVFPQFFYNWWQAFKTWIMTTLATDQDLTFNRAGKGIILKSPDGTKRKRVYLKNDGTLGLEDV